MRNADKKMARDREGKDTMRSSKKQIDNQRRYPIQCWYHICTLVKKPETDSLKFNKHKIIDKEAAVKMRLSDGDYNFEELDSRGETINDEQS